MPVTSGHPGEGVLHPTVDGESPIESLWVFRERLGRGRGDLLRDELVQRQWEGIAARWCRGAWDSVTAREYEADRCVDPRASLAARLWVLGVEHVGLSHRPDSTLRDLVNALDWFEQVGIRSGTLEVVDAVDTALAV